MTLENHQRQRLEDLALLTSALQTGHAYVPQLVHAAKQMMSQAQKILAKT
jgi:hypothetical protein